MAAHNSRNVYFICFMLSVLLHLSLNLGSIELPAHHVKEEEPMKVLLNYCIPDEPAVAEIPENAPVIKQAGWKPETVRRQTDKKLSAQEVKTPSVPAVLQEIPQAQVKDMPQPEAPAAVKVTYENPPVVKQEQHKKPAFDYTGYRARLTDALEAEKSYPYIARRKGLEGLVSVRAFVNADGSLKSAEVEKSSGHGLLDKEALKLVLSAFPFEKGSGEEFNILIPVRYSLEG